MAWALALLVGATGWAQNAPTEPKEEEALAMPKMTVTEQQIIELPPFVVTHTPASEDWRYGSCPGFEVLSETKDPLTYEVLGALVRGRYFFLPPSLQQRFSVPMTVVVYNRPPENPVTQAGMGSVLKEGEFTQHWTNVIKRTLPDRESFSVNLWDSKFLFTPNFRFDTNTLLRARAPAAPAWLEEGLFGKYGLYREGLFWKRGETEAQLVRAKWFSPEEAKRMRELNLGKGKKNYSARLAAETAWMVSIIPDFKILLENPPARDDSAWERWSSAAGLFVRWCISDRKQADAARFWRYAERACSEPVTEVLFRECLGLDYADARVALARYLPEALSEWGKVPTPDVPRTPDLNLRRASPQRSPGSGANGSASKGEVLEPRYPRLAQEYRNKALGTMGRSDQMKDRDPRLLTSLGLLAFDSGDFPRAVKFLEAAVAADVPGPRIYFETARLRWAAAAGQPSPETLAGVIALLMKAEQQTPAQPGIYALLAEAIRRSGPPTEAQKAALQRGRTFFPNDPALHRRLAQAAQEVR